MAKRFVTLVEQGNPLGTNYNVFVDMETGVNYLFVKEGYGAGLTVLVDEEGKPVITDPNDLDI